MCQTNLKQSTKLFESGITEYLLKKGIKPVGFHIKYDYYRVPQSWIQDEKPYDFGWVYFNPEYHDDTEEVFPEEGHCLEVERIPSFSSNDLWKAMPKIIEKTDKHPHYNLIYCNILKKFIWEKLMRSARIVVDHREYFWAEDDLTQCLVDMWTWLMKNNLLEE